MVIKYVHEGFTEEEHKEMFEAKKKNTWKQVIQKGINKIVEEHGDKL